MNPMIFPYISRKLGSLKLYRRIRLLSWRSPTGSGKTTQLPIILYEAGYAADGKIGITQPRIATLSVSDFIARQLNTTVPGVVGYKMRFEDVTAPNTAIK